MRCSRLPAVDGGVDAVLAEHGDGDDRDLLRRRGRAVAAHLAQLPAPYGARVGARQARRLQEPVRVEPQVELPQLGVRGRRGQPHRRPRRRASRRVRRRPRTSARGPLLQRPAAAPAEPVLPAGRVASRLALEAFRHGPGCPVHRAGVAAERLAPRPVGVVAGEALLADHAGVGVAGDGDAAQVAGADRRLGRFEHGPRIDVSGRQRLRRRQALQNGAGCCRRRALRRDSTHVSPPYSALEQSGSSSLWLKPRVAPRPVRRPADKARAASIFDYMWSDEQHRRPPKPHTVRLGGAARGNGVPASSRRGFGAQPHLVMRHSPEWECM